MTTSQITIGIIYIVTGEYKVFWDDFYTSCQKYFCIDSNLMFYVFTDDPDSLKKYGSNIEFITIKDRGWLLNVMSKSHFISNNKALLIGCDYLFNINGNCIFLDTILSEEIIPSENQDHLVCLCFDYNEYRNPDQYPYERNPLSTAYIPFGQGSKYYQAGFYGGRTDEMFKLADWLARAADEDLGKRIIAPWHDESYLNRYLLDLNPKVLNSTYGEPLEWVSKSNKICKVIFANKVQVFGNLTFRKIKECYLDPQLHFLLNDEFIAIPIAVIDVEGDLAASLFQIAFFFYLSYNGEIGRKYYLHISPQSNILDLYPELEKYTLPETWRERINLVQPSSKLEIRETENRYHLYSNKSGIAEPIVVYSGGWQNKSYANYLPPAYKNAIAQIGDEPEIDSACVIAGIYIDPQSDIDNICTEKYYSDALKHIEEWEHSDAIICVIISPDTEWAKKKYDSLFSTYKHTYRVLDGESADSFRQYVNTLRKCKYYVSDNSIQSWWGASFNDTARVLVPSFWTYKNDQLLKEEWFKVTLDSLKSTQIFDDIEIILPIDVKDPAHLSNWEYLSLLFKQLRGVTVHFVCNDISKSENLKFLDSFNYKVHETTGGYSAAKNINYALQRVVSKYVVVWDIAQMISPFDFYKAYDALKRNKDAVVTASGCHYKPEDYRLNEFKSSEDFRYIMKSTYQIFDEYDPTFFFISRENYLSIGAENDNIFSKEYLNKDRKQRLDRYKIEHVNLFCDLYILPVRSKESEQHSLRSDLESYVKTCKDL